MSKIVIFGNGDIAELAHYYFTHDSGHAVAGFAVDSQYRQADAFLGLPNVDFESVEERFPPRDYDFFVAVSYAQMNGLRDARCRAAKDKGYRLVSYISSRATVFPDLSENENCFILEDNTVQPFVKIGNNVTLWSGNHIGHHSVIGDNTFITSHVVISGGVDVGRNCFIGVNATVHDHVRLADYTLVGAASLINKDTEPYGVYIGIPAEKSRVPSNRLKL